MLNDRTPIISITARSICRVLAKPLLLVELFNSIEEVKRHYPYFLACVKQHGSEAVKRCLDKGHAGKLRLTFLKNKKDRYQMMQLLNLV